MATAILFFYCFFGLLGIINIGFQLYLLTYNPTSKFMSPNAHSLPNAVSHIWKEHTIVAPLIYAIVFVIGMPYEGCIFLFHDLRVYIKKALQQ